MSSVVSIKAHCGCIGTIDDAHKAGDRLVRCDAHGFMHVVTAEVKIIVDYKIRRANEGSIRRHHG